MNELCEFFVYSAISVVGLSLVSCLVVLCMLFVLGEGVAKNRKWRE